MNKETIMPEDRTPLIIVGVLGLVFVIALFEKLGQPMPAFRGDSEGGGIANFIYLAVIGTMLATFFFTRGSEKAAMFRNLLIWGAIITGIVFVVQLFGGK